MDCMQFGKSCLKEYTHSFQYRKRYGLHAMETDKLNANIVKFQYRKRYGLHAI